MREGIEKAIYEAFNRIIKKHGNAIWTIDTLEYLIYQEHLDEYCNLTEEERHEVDMFMHVLKLLFK